MPLWIVLVLAYLFEFANGWTDAPNSIATVVSTRVLRPFPAVLMAAVLNLVGALTGTAVAKTIAGGIVDPNFVTLETIAAALLAAFIWAVGAQYYGLPSSESHALVAGLLGAGFAAGGLGALEWSGTSKSLEGLVISPVGGFLSGFLLMVLIYRIFRRVRRSLVTRIFGRAQIFSAGFMAFSHGTNDAQKSMGIITLAILVAEAGPVEGSRSVWMIVSAALLIGGGHDGRRVAWVPLSASPPPPLFFFFFFFFVSFPFFFLLARVQRAVLALAEDAEPSRCSSGKFLAIFASNLDEFFQVRVSGLQEQVAAGRHARRPRTA